jgi:hypothetical protein
MPGQVFTAGLSASFSQEAIKFIRLLDKNDHDPALMFNQRREFVQRMRALFIDGAIFNESGDPVGACLEIILKQARSAAPIVYDGGKVIHLYQRPSSEAAAAVASNMRELTNMMIERLEAEFTTDDLGILFSAFDLGRSGDTDARFGCLLAWLATVPRRWLIPRSGIAKPHLELN